MMTKGEELLAAGWDRRFAAGGERLSLAIESFEEMGHEVRLLDVGDDVPLAADGQCDQCSGTGDGSGLKVIFSRKRPTK